MNATRDYYTKSVREKQIRDHLYVESETTQMNVSRKQKQIQA